MRCVVLLAVGLTRRRGRGLVRVTQILGGSLSGVSKPKKKPSLQVANLESNSPGSRMIAPDGLADMQAARRTRFWTKPPRGGPRSGGESLACSGRVRGAALQESPRLKSPWAQSVPLVLPVSLLPFRNSLCRQDFPHQLSCVE